ncbi:MAG: hypothetical protein ACTHMM_21215 [Agriterribacter sp.]
MITPSSVQQKKDARLVKANIPAHEYLQLFGNKIDITPAYAEYCKRSFYAFVKTFWNVVMPSAMVDNWHIKFLCDKAQEVVTRVIHKKAGRDLLINLPPGTSKSAIFSIFLPAWVLAVDPSLMVISGSCNYTLAESLSTKCRTVIQSDKYRAFFPLTKLNPVQDSKGHFETVTGGGRITCSVGTTVIGKHSDLILIDDGESYEMAQSPIERAKVQSWLKGDLSTRKRDKLVTSSIYIQQRLGFSDSSAFLLELDPDIEHVCLPACIDDEKVAALVKPASLKKFYKNNLMDVNRLSHDHMAKILKDMKGNTLRFETEMNQNTTDESKAQIKRDWFPIVNVLEFLELVKKYNAHPFYAMDTAFTNNLPTRPGRRANRNDPSVNMCYYYIENEIYIFKLFRKFLEGPELIDETKAFLKETNYHPTKSSISIEKKASGHTVYQFLKKDGLNIKDAPEPKDSKAARLIGISGSLSAKRVKLVEGAWNEVFYSELCVPFEIKKFWDVGDTLCIAVEEHIGGDGPRPVSRKRFGS